MSMMCSQPKQMIDISTKGTPNKGVALSNAAQWSFLLWACLHKELDDTSWILSGVKQHFQQHPFFSCHPGKQKQLCKKPNLLWSAARFLWPQETKQAFSSWNQSYQKEHHHGDGQALFQLQPKSSSISWHPKQNSKSLALQPNVLEKLPKGVSSLGVHSSRQTGLALPSCGFYCYWKEHRHPRCWGTKESTLQANLFATLFRCSNSWLCKKLWSQSPFGLVVFCAKDCKISCGSHTGRVASTSSWVLKSVTSHWK